MRLTLRTLLAYLDDTLEPTEIKQIGQKVAESDAAQELIARIKQVTRRRRLTTPPLTGPGSKFDSNLIAEYLDNELSGEQVAEIEKVCLESDVHLAEIAASHQILTLVLGEPALVPPTARERMYGLVKGREAIPFRKASSKSVQAVGKQDADDEDAVLGLPVHKRHTPWLKWAIPIAGLFLLVALGAALYSVFRDTRPPQVASNGKENTDPDPKKDPNAEADKAAREKAEAEKAAQEKAEAEKAAQEKAAQEKADREKADREKVEKGPQDKDKPFWPERVKEPAKDRREIATYNKDGAPRMNEPSILAMRKRDQEAWMRVRPGARLSSDDALVSLPGYASDLRTDSNVQLLLWGMLPEFNMGPTQPFIYECAVTLHNNPDVDLEFTLDRGRVYLANRKKEGPARVRLRFHKEIWDFVLQEPDSEIVLELFSQNTERINYLDGEEPESFLTLFVTNGSVTLKHDNYHELPNLQAPPGQAFVAWSNKASAPDRANFIDKDWPIIKVLGKEGTPESAVELRKLHPALDGVSGLTTNDTKPIQLMLVEGLKKGTFPPQEKALCVYCLGALDAVPALLDILGSEDADAALQRYAAVDALRRWLTRGSYTAKMLYDQSAKPEPQGLLLKKGYKGVEAETMLQLLYFEINKDTRSRPDTYHTLANYLRHQKLGVRVAAYSLLQKMTWVVHDKMPPYDPGASPAERDKAASAWEALVQKGDLPPKAPMPMNPMPPK